MIDRHDMSSSPSAPSKAPSQDRRLWLMLGLASAAGAAGLWLKPGGRRPADKTAATTAFNLDDVVPRAFGGWKELPLPGQAVNPQTQAIIDRIYSQTLGRAYVNANGYVVMLSLAYGADQRGNLEAHMPEVCYPAQGFKVLETVQGELRTPRGAIAVKRLHTRQGSRNEPLTYWFTIGSNNVRSRTDKRIAELRMALTGQVPDGLLFRVSSIDPDQRHAWGLQDQFVNDLLAAVPIAIQARLAGV
jgi:EpsI family protein